MIHLTEAGVSAVILGIMQDGGLPHIGCRCPRCAAVYDGTSRPEYAACLAIVDSRGAETAVWLIDATPDIKYQLDLLAEALGPHPVRPGRLQQFDGLFLTHAHMGHIGGLPQLGPEAMGVDQCPVYASPGLVALLGETRLWRPLTQNLDLRLLIPDEAISLAPDLHITPIPVPHRDEWGTGTFAFQIQGPTRSLLYLPDIDSWEEWPQAKEHLSSADITLVDACFFSAEELGGRPPVVHPLIPHTLELFADLPCQLVLTHFNHTNPALERHSEARQIILDAGVHIAQTGRRFPL